MKIIYFKNNYQAWFRVLDLPNGLSKPYLATYLSIAPRVMGPVWVTWIECS